MDLLDPRTNTEDINPPEIVRRKIFVTQNLVLVRRDSEQQLGVVEVRCDLPVIDTGLVSWVIELLPILGVNSEEGDCLVAVLLRRKNLDNTEDIVGENDILLSPPFFLKILLGKVR